LLNQNTEDKIIHGISADIKRSGDRCTPEFKVDHLTGENPLFNVLKAYANYDPEIVYC
jgi:hypothetical protein